MPNIPRLPKCPKCGTELDYYDIFDTEHNDDIYIDYCYGYCPQCETDYHWEEVYQYKEQRNLHEI
jgi:endogenous inhibitor of DNA gyrase (YacG/DUF329 family)